MIKKNSSLFLFLLFLYSIFCALQLGVTWDTFFYYELGKDRLDYLLTLGNDESFKKIPKSISTCTCFSLPNRYRNGCEHGIKTAFKLQRAICRTQNYKKLDQIGDS
mgnify:CR=1 FL=1